MADGGGAEAAGARRWKTDARRQVGRFLYLIRMELDPNRVRFARGLGVHYSVWAKWEKGQRYPDPAVMMALCDAHGVTMDAIYRGILEGIPNRAVRLRLADRPEFAAQEPAPGPGGSGASAPGRRPGTSGSAERARSPRTARAQAT